MTPAVPSSLLGTGHRRYRRFTSQGVAVPRLTVITQQGASRCVPLDLSLGGLAIDDRRGALQEDERCEIELNLDGTVLLLQAVTVHRSDAGRVGLRFLPGASLEAAWLSLVSILTRMDQEVARVA